MEECYNCLYFKYYNHATGNIHCHKHGIYQLGFGERMYCSEYKMKEKDEQETKIACYDKMS